MKIDRVSSLGTAPARRAKRAGAKGEAFSEALGSAEAPAASAVSGGNALGPVEALIAVQEASAYNGRRSAPRRRGEEMLDKLEEMRLGLLAGGLPAAAVERLADLVAARRGAVDDPRLAEILDEIEVRAAVELAKLGR